MMKEELVLPLLGVSFLHKECVVMIKGLKNKCRFELHNRQRQNSVSQSLPQILGLKSW